jgi:hypothetical protein
MIRLFCLCLKWALAANAPSCLETSKSFFGNQAENTGDAFTDLTYLLKNEDSKFYPRLQSIKLCADSEGNL